MHPAQDGNRGIFNKNMTCDETYWEKSASRSSSLDSIPELLEGLNEKEA
jgi:hypothetical protein